MAETSEHQPTDIVHEFGNALEECKELYRAGGFEIAQYHPELIVEPPRQFMNRMLDLFRGLAVKIFVDVALADGTWTREEEALARELFLHVWGERLHGDQLQQALQHVEEQRFSVPWDPLLSPFERLAPLRDQVSRLQTLVLRMANLVAKVDGRISKSEIYKLQALQKDLQMRFEPIRLDEPGRHESAQESGRSAVKQIAAQADQLRSPWQRDQPAAGNLKQQAHEQNLSEALAELDGLIGLATIKQEVRSLVNYLQMQKERLKLNLPQTPISLHSVFTGNPGTGKTTVARLLGRIFGAMGILAKGHLIETDRSGLVAEYAGQTGPKTNQRIDQALDGVLFIDEAYSLVAETGDDPYGAEAVQALLKRMEDDRKRLVIILAGYPSPMEQLLATNPGFSSRFSRTIHFPDYTASELGSIFQSLCRKSAYELPLLTRVKLLLGFQCLLERRDEHFGNGRLARNIFERAIGQLANRIAGVVPLTREMLTQLLPEDIVMEGVPGAVWDNLTDERRRFRAPCPGCQQSCSLPQTFLGRTVQCQRCQRQFCVDWAEIETA